VTEPSCELTYTGPIARGSVSVPGRRVGFERGCPVRFTATEAETLGDDWEGDRPPAGSRDVIDDAGELVLEPGRQFGTVTVTVAAATSSERARALLDHELSLPRPRPSLVAKLEQLVDVDHPAGDAGTDQEA